VTDDGDDEAAAIDDFEILDECDADDWLQWIHWRLLTSDPFPDNNMLSVLQITQILPVKVNVHRLQTLGLDTWLHTEQRIW